jgi:hypothetical protein
MNLIVCIDDGGGMHFNRRRQSSDRYVTERIVNLAKESRLLVNSYTAKLFPEETVVRSEQLWEAAQTQDYCFVEDKDVAAAAAQADKIVVFHWNRKYPADLYFPLDALEKRKLIQREEFPGYSHERITMEVYDR